MRVLPPRSPGAQLAMLLIDGFNAMTNEVVAELANRGHEGVRAVHAFALEAIDGGAVTASDLGRALQVSKQAAAKTIDALERMGYVERQADPGDARCARLRITPRGCELIEVGGALFDGVRAAWATQIGYERLSAFESDLKQVAVRSPRHAVEGSVGR